MTSAPPSLPPDITVFERGWLSSNNILIRGQHGCAMVDSGYSSHAGQTLALVGAALQDRPLDLLLNTHLHSDHCGGNAALQQAYPVMQTLIPPGLAQHVRDWDPVALTYTPTGQICPPFRFDALLQPGSEIELGDKTWQVHAAPGHDTHSVVLFEPASCVLISADALWERGFGVVFPELEGLDAFDEVGQTIDLIESLAPRIVIPGHGAVFTDVAGSITAARARLRGFAADPGKHIQHAAKVLLKFKLLEVQSLELATFVAWARATPYFVLIYQRHFSETEFSQWVGGLIDDLVRVGAAAHEGGVIRNAG
ncbi:MBL fold metallo-hydrolase [Rhodoferax sp.]|uniref:MBL fold metallo-hydrolase n=1 Tax=Rhodoferax sp. TaxID=50421 RepID=UPI00274619D9|nr:MBL fold metallo-hydrolase [Rhodoferax sp.]